MTYKTSQDWPAIPLVINGFIYLVIEALGIESEAH